jgi:hypothetical protein
MFKPMMAMLCAGAGLLGMIYFTGPDLWRDYRLRGEPMLPAAHVRIKEAKCVNHWFFVYADCTIRFTGLKADKTDSVSYTFLGTGPSRFMLLHPARDPNIVVADIGLTKFWNRFSSLALLGIGMCGVMVWGVRRVAAA